MAKSQDTEVNRFIIQGLGKKCASRWLLDASLDWVIIVATLGTTIYWNNPLGYITAVFILGNRQHALALLGHDGTHYTIHRNKKLNDYISDLLAFWPVGLTTSGYRNVHFLHHKNLNTESDPELMHRSMKAPQWDLPITVKKIFRLSCIDMMGYSASDYWMIVKSAKPDFKSTYKKMIGFHIAFSSLFIMAGLPQIPLLWYGSLLTSFMMFFRIRTWFEHQGSEGTHKMELNLLQSVIFSPHSSWYHHEHHMYPTVPYHRLHLVRKKMGTKEAMNIKNLMDYYKDSRPIQSGTALKDVAAHDKKYESIGTSQQEKLVA